MADLRDLFRVLDDVAAPERLPPVRRPGRPPPPAPRFAQRAAAIVLALGVAGASFVLVTRAIRRDERVVSGPATGGLIAFTAGPREPEPTGTIQVGGSGDAGPPAPPAQVYVARADGSGLRQLTDDPSVKGSLAWAPDGSRIAYTAYDVEEGVERLFLIAPDGTDRRLVCEGCTGTFWVPEESGDALCIDFCEDVRPAPSGDELRWSSEGWIASPATPRSGVSLIDPTSGDVRVVRTPGVVNGTSWSPDGGQLALSVEGRGDAGLYVLDVAVGELRPLYRADPYGGAPPAWSPDGTVIAFAEAATVGGDLHAELVFVGRDGSSETIVGSDSLFEIYDLAWEPSGHRLAVLHHPVDPPTAGLLTVSADGSDVEMVAICEAGREVDGLCSTNGGSVAWSPDGTQVLFVNHDGDAQAVTVVTLADRTATAISGDLEPGCCLAWQPGAPG